MTEETITTNEMAKEKNKKRYFIVETLIRLVKEKPMGSFGLIIVLALLFTGIFADFLAPYPMNKISLEEVLSPPSSAHLLGTDNLGRDVLSKIIYGARISLIVGLSATLLTTIICTIIGTLSAIIGGRFDIILQRFVDGWQAIPGLLILLIMMSIIGAGIWQLIIAISIPGGIGASRFIRGAVFSIKENPYVDAERAIGCTTRRLIVKHIIPNIMPFIIIGFSMGIGGTILQEAGLSFLGFGVPPGVDSWGSMLSQEGRTYMEIAPFLAIWPGLALSLVVFGTNMFGDAMRDLLDPKLKGGLGRYGGASRTKQKLKDIFNKKIK